MASLDTCSEHFKTLLFSSPSGGDFGTALPGYFVVCQLGFCPGCEDIEIVDYLLELLVRATATLDRVADLSAQLAGDADGVCWEGQLCPVRFSWVVLVPGVLGLSGGFARGSLGLVGGHG